MPARSRGVRRVLKWLKRLVVVIVVLGIVALAVVAGLLAFGPDDFQGTLESELDVDLDWLPEPLRDDTTTTVTPAAPAAVQETCDRAVEALAGVTTEQVTIRPLVRPLPWSGDVDLNVDESDDVFGLCFALDAGDVLLVTESAGPGRVGVAVAAGGFDLFFVDEVGARTDATPHGVGYVNADGDEVGDPAEADPRFAIVDVEPGEVVRYAIEPMDDDVVLLVPVARETATVSFDVRLQR